MKAYTIDSADHCPKCKIKVTNFTKLPKGVRRYECENCGLKYSHNLYKKTK